MSFSRRNWKRELLELVRWPLSMLESKAESNKRKRFLSQFRVIVFMFAVAYVMHWPSEWNVWGWAALTTIALALPVSDLFAMIPVSEGLAALTALFGGVVGKRMATKSVTVEETTTTGPVVEAPRVPGADV